MKRNPSNVHPEDTILLAYLDAELPKPAMRSTAQHLQTCWKCRAALADLELQAQAASKILTHQVESDISRADAAKTKFIERKARFEARSRRSVIWFMGIPTSRHIRVGKFGWLEKIVLRTA
jgi:anti-sigma factor RsiW